MSAIKTIRIYVRDRVADSRSVQYYVLDNDGYEVIFDFDDEWAAYDVKTALFVYGSGSQPVVFSGNVCHFPRIKDTSMIQIGVFAGNLQTTTPAIVYGRNSILSGTNVPDPPPQDVYNQIMEELNRIDENMEASVAAALVEAKESGQFDGPPGPQGEPGKDAVLPVPIPYEYMPDGYPRANDTEVVLPETTMVFSGGYDRIESDGTLIETYPYRLTIDGHTFEAVAQWDGATGYVVLGTESDPLMVRHNYELELKAAAGEHTVRIDRIVERTVEPMAEEFLPPIPYEKMPEGYPTKADGKVVNKLSNEFLDLDWLPTTKGAQLAAAKIVTNALGVPTATTGGFPDLTIVDVSEGMALIVVWDGAGYPVTVKQGGFLYAGNYGFLGGENTGEPFLLRFGDSVTSVFYRGGVPHVAAVYAVADNPIPDEFLKEHNADPAAHPPLQEAIIEQMRAEMLQMLSDLGLVSVASSDGSVLYTSNDGKIYVL